MRSITSSKYFVLIVAVIIVITGSILYINNPNPIEYDNRDETICAQDVLLCPDGSYVGREGKDCQFKTCPAPPPGTQFEDGTVENGDKQKPGNEESVFCTMDAMQCPDGTYVGRTGPKCEFICP